MIARERFLVTASLQCAAEKERGSGVAVQDKIASAELFTDAIWFLIRLKFIPKILRAAANPNRII